MDSEHGTYALILRAAQPAKVQVGKLGDLQILAGSYVYVGSAFGPGGVRARLRRHLRRPPRPHWHIDYLRRVVPPSEIWYAQSDVQREHLWASAFQSLPGARIPLRGFGASDCGCVAHLFYFEAPPCLAAFRRRVRARAPDHAPIERRRA